MIDDGRRLAWYWLGFVLVLLWPIVADAAGEVRRMRVTAYCPCLKCCGRHADGVTASGTRADHPLVAAARTWPFGTRVRVPGYAGGRTVLVEDRGGAITGDRLDLLFPTHAEALRWGVRYLDVTIDARRDGPSRQGAKNAKDRACGS